MKYLITSVRVLFLAFFLFLLANGKVVIWLVLFGVSLIAALLFGRVYCGYACPMNTLMIPVEWLSKKLKFQTENAPKWLKSGYFTWISLVVSIVVMMVSKKVLHRDLPVLPFWVVVSVLVTLRYKPEVFHNLICPFGALQKVFGQFAKISEKVETQACIGCKKCEKVCPSSAIVVNHEDRKAFITTALCHQCTNCQQVCPTHAIRYRK
jgi:polyferredoxin